MTEEKKLTPFDAFKIYQAIKLHFTSESYDAFKYNFKASNISPKGFLKRKDKFFYAKLAKKYENSQSDLINHIVSNIVYSGKSKWIGDLIDSSSDETYKKWLAVNESISYVFKKDINKLSDRPFNDILSTKDDQTYPFIISEFLSASIHIETIVILNVMTGFIQREDKNIKDPVLWPEVKTLITKYTPFVVFDQSKCRNEVLSSFTLVEE